MSINREYIDKTVSMLEGYLDRQRRISALRYDLEHLSRVSEEEVISQMALPGKHEDGGGRAVGHVSDKTMYIALNYRNQVNRLNSEEADRIWEQLTPLEDENERLEFYVGLLPSRLRNTLELHYFKGLTWGEVAKAEAISARAIAGRRSAAVEQLADLLFLTERGTK